jgi:histone-lysine N-methyltransferase SETMAR
MEWEHMSLPRTKKFKSVPSASKVMFVLGLSRPILKHDQENGQSVVYNIIVLGEELKPTIHSKHRGMLTNGAVLHHDNAGPHTTAAAIGTIQKLKLELFPHPAYSPDLIPSDYQFLDCSKMHYVDADLQIMKRSRTQCICGFAHN